MSVIEIISPRGKRKIGPNFPVFIIAEMSGNHNQDIERAFKIIDAAAEAGVDAVKLQTYTPDTMTIDCDKESFQVKVNDAWKGKTLYDLYKIAHTPWGWQRQLKEYGEAKGLLVFSTPFDETSVDFLENLNVALYKVASFEVTDLELLRKIGQTKKPVIISRGMASLVEITEAVKVLRESGASEVAVLHCVSSYPATLEQMNIATIPDIARRLDVVAGLSDHTLDITASLTSVGLGANIIEKHFTLRRSDGGPDAAFSLEPEEMSNLVKLIRKAEVAIGKPTYDIGKKEAENMVFRRSLFVVKDVKKGEVFTRENVRCIRPGYGMPPKNLPLVLGKTAKCDIERGTPFIAELIN